MKLASVILAILAGGVAAPAQWATNAWPSWDRPFRGIQRKDDVTNALTERCLAAKASLGDLGTLSGWFKQRRALVVCKATLKDLVGSYVDTDQADPDGSLDTWFAGGEAGPPMLTVTAVLSRAGAQSNYLDRKSVV